jgi:hypothetical protein
VSGSGTFNLDISFVETWVLPAVLGMDSPVSRMDYEGLQRALNESGIDFRIYCDPRMIAKGNVPPLRYIRCRCVSWLKAKSLIWIKSAGYFTQKYFISKITTERLLWVRAVPTLRLVGGGEIKKLVDFRCVASNAQYQQVKRFFTELITV